jgi:hypothetical protein
MIYEYIWHEGWQQDKSCAAWQPWVRSRHIKKISNAVQNMGRHLGELGTMSMDVKLCQCKMQDVLSFLLITILLQAKGPVGKLKGPVLAGWAPARRPLLPCSPRELLVGDQLAACFASSFTQFHTTQMPILQNHHTQKKTSINQTKSHLALLLHHAGLIWSLQPDPQRVNCWKINESQLEQNITKLSSQFCTEFATCWMSEKSML